MSEAESTRSDAEAFESLLIPILDSAYGMALKLAGNKADAEDLLQEAALLAFRGFHTFELGTNFKAWFFRILTNAFYGKKRKEKRRPTPVDIEDVPESYMRQRSREVGLSDTEVDAGARIVSEMDVMQVSQAIDALPEEYRVVAILYFLEDLAYQEIADVLEIPVGTVRSRLHRGRKMLQKMLWDIAEESGIIEKLGNSGGSR